MDVSVEAGSSVEVVTLGVETLFEIADIVCPSIAIETFVDV